MIFNVKGQNPRFYAIEGERNFELNAGHGKSGGMSVVTRAA